MNHSQPFSNAAEQASRTLDTLDNQSSTLQTSLLASQRTRQLLEELPKKLKHPAMIPFGNLAFFPGHLTNTNECLVKTGDYHLQVSAYEGKEILKRKEARIEAEQNRLQKQVSDLKNSLEVLTSPDGGLFDEEGNQVMEISEEYQEFLHGPLRQNEETSFLQPKSQGLAPHKEEAKSPQVAKIDSCIIDHDIDDDLFKRMEELEKEEEAAELQQPSLIDTQISEKNPGAKGIEMLPSEKSPDSKKPKAVKQVSWKDEVSEAEKSSQKPTQVGAKPTPMMRGFFNKPKSTALKKTAQPPTNKQDGPKAGSVQNGIKSESSQAPSVIAEVRERDINPAEEMNASFGAPLVENPGSNLDENSQEPPKRMSRFKQQRAGLRR